VIKLGSGGERLGDHRFDDWRERDTLINGRERC
jgi:hypothetical protein